MVKDNKSYDVTQLYNPDEIAIEDKDLAYIAGLFDGEVAFSIHRTGRSYGLYISYTKTNYDILKYLSNIFGGAVYRVKPQPYHRFKVWVWYLTSGNAYRALSKVYPFLRIKKEAAAICIEFFERYWRPRPTRPVSEERQAIGTKFQSRLQEYQLKPGSSKKPRPPYKRIEQQLFTMLKSYRLPDIKVPELELAYISGLLDVESSFIIYKLHNRPSYLLEVNYRKTGYNTLDYLANIFGGRVRPAPSSLGNILDVWLWKIGSVEAYRLLRRIYPFLRIKRRAAEICMEFFECYWRGRSTKPVSQERQAIGAKYADLLRQYHTKSMPHSWKDRWKEI